MMVIPTRSSWGLAYCGEDCGGGWWCRRGLAELGWHQNVDQDGGGDEADGESGEGYPPGGRGSDRGGQRHLDSLLVMAGAFGHYFLRTNANPAGGES
jgi:hypothetical protein